MYKYIIFSELCPGHNPRTQNATLLELGTGTWSVSKGIGLGAKLTAMGLDVWGWDWDLGHKGIWYRIIRGWDRGVV